MGERRNLPAPHAPPKVCLSESKCSHRLAVPAEGYHNTPNWQDGRGCQHGSRSYTRLMGQRGLPAPHAKPKAHLSEGKCSHRPRLCFCGSTPHTRMRKRRNLPGPHAKPKAHLSEGKCSRKSHRPRRLPGRQNNFLPESRKKKYSPSRAIPFYSPGKGVWGPCPHVYPKPLTFRPKPAAAVLPCLVAPSPFCGKIQQKGRPACCLPAPSPNAGAISPKLSPKTGGFSRSWDCRKSPGKSPARRYSPHP